MISKIGFLFMIVGLAFDFFGCLGLLRLPDIYNRLQAATKCITLGTCGILFGMALVVGVTAAGIKAILCLIFLLLTSPVAAHALAKAARIAGVKLWDGSVVDEYK